MKVGQTSVIVFLSKVVGSAFGFVATVYFARVLGAQVLGIYSVIVTLVIWFQIGGHRGILDATNKRISEGDDPGAYLVAGFITILIFALVMSLLIVLLQPFIGSFVDEFDEFASLSVIWYIIPMLVVQLGFLFAIKVLEGQQTVHISGLLQPTRTGVVSLLQIVFVFIGLQLVGLLVGYVLGLVIVTALAVQFIKIRPRMPTWKHVEKILGFAKYSWFGGLKARAFNDVDIIILNALVSTSLVGIYAVAWSLSTFLNLFGNAIQATIFPEVSDLSSQDALEEVSSLLEDALAFAGLLAIPGFVGGTILSDRILTIYGEAFVEGTEVLWLLLLAIVFFSYFQQFLTALNGIDRPDAAFRTNLVFIVSNVSLNVVLISRIGLVGAALASAISVFIGMLMAYFQVSQLIPLRIPFAEISKQVGAATLMGIVVLLGRTGIESTGFQHNFATVLGLVGVGALVYGTTLLAISPRFRVTVQRNLPASIDRS